MIVERPVEGGAGGGGTPGGGTTTPGGGTTTPGGTVPGGSGADVTAPSICVFKTSLAAYRRGAQVHFVITASEAGTATITVHRLAKGRKKGRKCVKPTRKLRKKKKSTRALKAGRRIVQPVRQGLSNLAVKTSRKARPGRYRATIVIRDAAGNVSAKRTTTYRLKRR